MPLGSGDIGSSVSGALTQMMGMPDITPTSNEAAAGMSARIENAEALVTAKSNTSYTSGLSDSEELQAYNRRRARRCARLAYQSHCTKDKAKALIVGHSMTI